MPPAGYLPLLAGFERVAILVALLATERFLELAHAVADRATDLGELLRAEHDQRDREDDDELEGSDGAGHCAAFVRTSRRRSRTVSAPLNVRSTGTALEGVGDGLPAGDLAQDDHVLGLGTEDRGRGLHEPRVAQPARRALVRPHGGLLELEGELRGAPAVTGGQPGEPRVDVRGGRRAAELAQRARQLLLVLALVVAEQ